VKVRDNQKKDSYFHFVRQFKLPEFGNRRLDVGSVNAWGDCLMRDKDY